jgi:hypothetical protein
MSPKTVEIEGTWEQISEQASHYPGHRMRLTILAEPVEGVVSDIDVRTIEEMIADIVANVPDAEWGKLPSDMGDNLDHYIYGTARTP